MKVETYCVHCYTDLVDEWTSCMCFPGEPTPALDWNYIRSSDFIVRHIPFYEGKTVQAAIHGRLRGRGSRRFANPRSPVHKYKDGTEFTYKMADNQLDQALPHHLATEFTLYHTQGGRKKVYTDFQRIREDGKIVIRLAV